MTWDGRGLAPPLTATIRRPPKPRSAGFHPPDSRAASGPCSSTNVRCAARRRQTNWLCLMAKWLRTAEASISSAPSPRPASIIWAAKWSRQRPTRSRPARALCERPELTGWLGSVDALHTQTATDRAIVMGPGGDYVLTVKANQPCLQAAVQTHVPEPGSPFLTT